MMIRHKMNFIPSLKRFFPIVMKADNGRTLGVNLVTVSSFNYVYVIQGNYWLLFVSKQGNIYSNNLQCILRCGWSLWKQIS